MTKEKLYTMIIYHTGGDIKCNPITEDSKKILGDAVLKKEPAIIKDSEKDMIYNLQNALYVEFKEEK